jgi:hypothetical protein
MFSPEEMLFLGAATILIGVLACVSLFNFLMPQRQMDIMSGADVRIREEDLTSPQEATTGTCTSRPFTCAQVAGRLKKERERGFEDNE